MQAIKSTSILALAKPSSQGSVVTKYCLGVFCRELRLRKGYVEHLESMSLQKKDDEGTLQDKVLEQVTGVYKLAEDEAMERLSKQTMDLAQRANRLRPSEAPCKPERKDVIDCYGSNSKNPLACAGLVSAMEACAVQARKDAMQRIKPASA